MAARRQPRGSLDSYTDPDLARILTAKRKRGPIPHSRALVSKTADGKGLEIAGKDKSFCYVVLPSSGVFPMTLAQRGFYDYFVVLRDFDQAAEAAGVTREQADAYRRDPRAMEYVMSCIGDKAEANSLTLDRVDAMLSRALSGKMTLDKNRVKILELALKRTGGLVERRVLAIEDGTEMVFAFKGKPKEPAA